MLRICAAKLLNAVEKCKISTAACVHVLVNYIKLTILAPPPVASVSRRHPLPLALCSKRRPDVYIHSTAYNGVVAQQLYEGLI